MLLEAKGISKNSGRLWALNVVRFYLETGTIPGLMRLSHDKILFCDQAITRQPPHEIVHSGLYLVSEWCGTFACSHLPYYPRFTFGSIWRLDVLLLTFIGRAGAAFFVLIRDLLMSTLLIGSCTARRNLLNGELK
jgi:hypothetical protein